MASRSRNQPDGSYYNTGSCVHQLCITGIEITFENGPYLRLIKWGQATEGNALTIEKTVLIANVGHLMNCMPGE